MAVKYRIKEKLVGGNTHYIPQYKHHFWNNWSSFKLEGWEIIFEIKFNTYTEAEHFLFKVAKR
jgi:hypothetical protein